MQNLDAFTLYLRAECGVADQTVEAYTRDVRAVTAWMGANVPPVTWAACHIEDIRAYIRYATCRGLHANSIRRHIDSIRAMLRSICRDDLAREIEKPKAGYYPVTLIPTVLEVAALLASAVGNPRDLALLTTLYDCGLRASELCGLKVADLDHKSELITVQGKGNKIRRVPTTPEVRASVVAYLELRSPQPDDFIFLRSSGQPFTRTQIYKLVHRYARRSKQRIPGFHPHTLRHAKASHLFDKGLNEREIQEFLGHSDVKTTTLVYLHTDRYQLRKVFCECFPRERQARGEKPEIPPADQPRMRRDLALYKPDIRKKAS